MIENVVRHLAEKKPKNPGERLAIVRDAAHEVARPVFFAVLIITVVYLPILTLEGVEGKMFRPMALTIIFALLGSLFFSLTLMPVLSSFFLKKVSHEEPWLIRKIKAFYAPWLDRAMRPSRLSAVVHSSRCLRMT